VIISKPIVYGNFAFPFAQPNEHGHTHQWTVFVRGAQNEDLSVYVKRVIFTLHPSFEQPIRTLDAPPYEVTESGWGEFEVTIKLVFRDTSEKAVEMPHMLRLYPPPDQSQLSFSHKNPLFTEVYDEIIFSQPRPNLAQLLEKDPYSAEVAPHSLAHPSSVEHFSQKMTLDRIQHARERIHQEVLRLRNEYELLDIERGRLAVILELPDAKTPIPEGGKSLHRSPPLEPSSIQI